MVDVGFPDDDYVILDDTSEALNNALASIATRRLLLPWNFYTSSPFKVDNKLRKADEPNLYINDGANRTLILRLKESHPELTLSALLPILVGALRIAASIDVKRSRASFAAYLDFPLNEVAAAGDKELVSVTPAALYPEKVDQPGQPFVKVALLAVFDHSGGDPHLQLTTASTA